MKLCLSGWPADAYNFPDSVELTDAEVAAVVSEARSRGKIVVAHALSAASRSLAESLSRATRLGVPLVFGTDGGVLPHGSNAQELVALTRAGIAPLEALRAATVNAARAYQLADSLGAIAPGMIADFIAV